MARHSVGRSKLGTLKGWEFWKESDCIYIGSECRKTLQVDLRCEINLLFGFNRLSPLYETTSGPRDCKKLLHSIDETARLLGDKYRGDGSCIHRILLYLKVLLIACGFTVSARLFWYWNCLKRGEGVNGVRNL